MLNRKILLSNNETLFSNDNVRLESKNGRYYMVIQDDGNLVVYEQSKGPIFSSNTGGNPSDNYKLILHQYGNLEIFDSSNNQKWATNTFLKGFGPYKLFLEKSGILILKDSLDNITWTSNSNTMVDDQQISSEPNHRTIFKSEIYSPDNSKKLSMRNNGDLIVCDSNNEQNIYWSSKSNGKAPFRFIVQEDGNLVVYDHDNIPTWASNTGAKGYCPFTLYLENNGDLILRESNGCISWSSNPSLQNPENYSYEDQILSKFQNQFLENDQPIESGFSKLLDLVKSFENSLSNKDINQIKTNSKEILEILTSSSQGITNQLLILKSYESHLGEIKGLLLYEEAEIQNENNKTKDLVVKIQDEIQYIAIHGSLKEDMISYSLESQMVKPCIKFAPSYQCEIIAKVTDLMNKVNCKTNVYCSKSLQKSKISEGIQSTNDNIVKSNQILGDLNKISLSISVIIDENNIIQIMAKHGDQFKSYVDNSMNIINGNSKDIHYTHQNAKNQFLTNIKEIKTLKL